MTDLQKQIEELEKVANQPQTDYSNSDCELCVDNYRSGIIDGEINFTKKALSIIKQLKKERDQALADYNMARDALTKQLKAYD